MTTARSDVWRRRILAWADDEFVLGHQLGDLVGTYFDLEEAVAIGSLSQDHLVHARELYGLLGIEEDDLDRFVFERDSSEFLNSQLVEVRVDEDFAALVVKMALYSTAEEIRVVATAADGTVGDIAGRMLEEEAYHREHWWDWMAVLAGSEEGRPRLQRALDVLASLASDFFDADGEDVSDALAKTGEWRSGVSRRLEELGVGQLAELPASGASGRNGVHGPDLAMSLASLTTVREPGRIEVTWG